MSSQMGQAQHQTYRVAIKRALVKQRYCVINGFDGTDGDNCIKITLVHGSELQNDSEDQRSIYEDIF